jgi:16S rRNA G966 N2-methylase RsmD
LYPSTIKPYDKFDEYFKCDIINFLKNENITFYNKEAYEIYNKYINNKNALIIFDPPYMLSCNGYYECLDQVKKNNIYEDFNEKIENNNIYKSKMYFILENNWIIRLLFKKWFILETYQKCYSNQKKKQTQHIIITNIKS